MKPAVRSAILSAVLTAFYILIGLQIVLGLVSLLQGMGWLRFVKRRLRAEPGGYAPRVAVICPCKGREPGLEENLAALTRFDYPDYEIFFVIAEENDPAREVIEAVAERAARRAHLVLAGAAQDCGEKVNNLRAAVERVGRDFEVLVFTDSDARTDVKWLRRLVAPLADARTGAATTFRWYLPRGVSSRWGVAGAFLSAWNAAIVTMLGEHSRNFCWGGGTAIRRRTFEEVRVLDFWKGAVSDDYGITRALEAAGRPIVFVPECLTATLDDATARTLLEFTNRQVMITRVYAPRMWRVATLSHAFYGAALFYSALTIAARACEGKSWMWPTLAALLIPLLAAAKGALRGVAAAKLLPEWKAQVHQWRWAWMMFAPLVSFLYVWNSIVAMSTRRIWWRGIRYEVVSPNETKILSRQ
jgi:ceramide glucosyltransferase